MNLIEKFRTVYKLEACRNLQTTPKVLKVLLASLKIKTNLKLTTPHYSLRIESNSYKFWEVERCCKVELEAN